MQPDEVIKFNNVGKKFKKGRKLLLKEAMLDIFKPGKTVNFWALNDISFTIKKGDIIGIIGTNGSGKSTILKLVAGVMSPDKGKVEVSGRTAPLIELGAGFHPELSGRENVYLNGVILGLNKKEIDKKFDKIIKFAELEEFIDTPVKHYSSGMYMRLGFSIAIHTNPDILLVDEILSVGDTSFQRKCMLKMEEFRQNKVTILFVGHNLKTIREFCCKTIYIKNGKIAAMGDTKDVVEIYLRDSYMDIVK